MFGFLIFVFWFLGLLILLVFVGILIIYSVGGVCMAVFKEDQFLVPKSLYAVWYDDQVTMKDGVMTCVGRVRGMAFMCVKGMII